MNDPDPESARGLGNARKKEEVEAGNGKGAAAEIATVETVTENAARAERGTVIATGTVTERGTETGIGKEREKGRTGIETGTDAGAGAKTVTEDVTAIDEGVVTLGRKGFSGAVEASVQYGVTRTWT